MANNSLTQLKGTSYIGDASIKEQIEAGIIYFLNWAFLGIGAFLNINKDNTTYLGGDESQLAVVEDPNYTIGKVWQAARYDWVWESGIEFPTQPINISGVWVNGDFKLLNDPSGYAHYIDYPHGQVIFTTAISPSSIVEAEYSYRYVHVTSVDDSPYMQELQFNSLNYSHSNFQQSGSGIWDNSAEHRLQMPLVGVEIGRFRYRPYQIGGGQWQFVDVLFTVAAENSHDRDIICDILASQSERHIYLLDTNMMADSGVFPLNSLGQLTANPIMYPQLLETYPFHKCKWIDSRKVDFMRLNQNLYIGRVQTTFELVRLSI